MTFGSMSKIEILLNEYRNEFNKAASSFYAWKVLAKLPLYDKQVHDALNRNADSWILIRYSLQTTFIVALGRIFDTNRSSLNIHRFLDACKSEISQFSKSAFEARRIRDNHGQRPDYLDDYIKGIYEAVESDFDELIKVTDEQAAIYRLNYKPIRHKVVAHKDFDTFLSEANLFAPTDLDEIEKILELLFRVERVVSDLLMNGEKRSLDFYSFDRKRNITHDLENLLRKLPL
jgi:hypothetical protein